MSDNDFVKAKYVGPKGNHHVHGSFLFDYDPGVTTTRKDGKWRIYYGYNVAHLAAEGTLVHREDVRLQPNLWREEPTIAPPPQVPRPVLGEPKPIGQAKDTRPLQPPPSILEEIAFDLNLLPVTAKIADEMRKAGLDSKEAILEAGVEGLTAIKGIANNRARAILRMLNQ